MTRVLGFDPSQVVSFGVMLFSGPAGAGATPVVFDVDSFSLE